MSKVIKRVTRSTVEGNLVRVKQPEFLTLTKRPANQRAFSMIRSDQGADMAQTTAPVARRTRTKRSDDTKNLAVLTFPAGYTQEQVTASLADFGLASGYTVSEEGGVFKARRSDLQSIADGSTVSVKLTQDGIMAQIVRGEEAPVATEGQHGIKLVALEFDIEKFEEEKIPAFLQRNSVDFSEDQLDNSANDKTVLKRSEVGDGVETRRIELEPGVVAVIARADSDDVPAGFAMAVNEIAYGNWGWGQLDFNAAMADMAVCEMLEDGIWKLRQVLDNILFWSQLTVDAKKSLVQRTTAQFADFVNGVLDLLPRQVLVAVGQTQRSDLGHNQEKAMANPEAKGNDTQQQPAAQDDAQPLTRADVTAIINESLGGLKTELTELVRSALPKADDSATPAQPNATQVDGQGATNTPAAAATEQAVTRSELVAAFSEAIKPMVEKLETMQSTTIVRSDNADPVATAKAGDDNKVKRGDAIFKGALGLPK